MVNQESQMMIYEKDLNEIFKKEKTLHEIMEG